MNEKLNDFKNKKLKKKKENKKIKMLKTLFIFFIFFICVSLFMTYDKKLIRCCYSCDFDDDFTLLGCPICPNGYPCVFPCFGKC